MPCNVRQQGYPDNNPFPAFWYTSSFITPRLCDEMQSFVSFCSALQNQASTNMIVFADLMLFVDPVLRMGRMHSRTQKQDFSHCEKGRVFCSILCILISGSHQAVFRQSSGICQAFVRHLSGICLAFVKHSTGICQAFIRRSSSICQAFVRH